MKKIKTFIILIFLLSPTVIYGNSISDSVNIQQTETIPLFSSGENTKDTNTIKLKRYSNLSKAVPYIYALGVATQCVGLTVALGESGTSNKKNKKKENTGIILLVSGGLISTLSPAISSISASSSRYYLVKAGDDPGSHHCWVWWATGIGLKIVSSISTANSDDVVLPTVLSLLGESFYFVSISKSIRFTRSNYTKKEFKISIYPYNAGNNSIGIALQSTF